MADDEHLIALVRENDILYDLTHSDYMRTKLKDEIWDKIGAEVASNGKTVKEQWRKLREHHREALRRQKMRKSGGKAEFQKVWTYQQQMDFLIPYMKNRSTCTNVEQQPSTEINAPNDGEIVTKELTKELDIDNSNEPEQNQSANSDTPTVKRTKQSDQTAIRRFIQTAEMRSRDRDNLRKTMLQRDPSESLQNDALYQFFLSMYYTTKGLPGKYQRRIRNTLYEAVSEAEEENDFGAATGTPTFRPSYREGTANLSSSFTGQINQNIIHQAFPQAGEEENDFEGNTTSPFSPPYSQGTASSLTSKSLRRL